MKGQANFYRHFGAWDADIVVNDEVKASKNLFSLDEAYEWAERWGRESMVTLTVHVVYRIGHDPANPVIQWIDT